MSSPARVRANRRNAQKSTGPRTDAGKSHSCMNALQSGIHAESHIIRGEDPAGLDRLAADYHAEFHPATPRQRDLVDAIVDNEWKIRRLRYLESEIWQEQLEIQDKTTPSRTNHLAMAFDLIENRLERLQRRLHAYERSTQRALKELHALQLKQSEPDAPIGFVPSDSPAAPPATAPDASPAPALQPPAPNPEPSSPVQWFSGPPAPRNSGAPALVQPKESVPNL